MPQTILFIACLVLIAAGAALIYLPAGLIVGGALGAWTLIRDAKATPSTKGDTP